MKKWQEYITEKALLKRLCRWRAYIARKRDPKIRLSSIVKGMKCTFSERDEFIQRVLPPRRKWIRLGFHVRKEVGELRLLEKTIYRSATHVLGDVSAKDSEWVKNFRKLVAKLDEIRTACEVSFNSPTIHLVPKSDGSCRCLASFDSPADRLLLSQAATYLRDIFDPIMEDCSFAFRKDGTYNYKSAIDELIRYRRKHAGERLYVAECDIQSFFDVIDHRIIEAAYDGFVQQLPESERPDPELRKILKGYLRCFTSRGNLNESTDERIVSRRHLVKPLEETNVGRFYPGQNLLDVKLGIPQGGALSPLIANLVLHSADRAVNPESDDGLLYLRFCDDVIIVHTDKDRCKKALARYMNALEMLKLPIHPLRRRVCYGPEYYNMKSKGPFVWTEPNSKQKSAIPWVSFLGVHVRYDGAIRVRQSSLKKHEDKLKIELRRYKDAVGEEGCNLKDGSVEARERLLRAFEARVVAMGVGYSTMRHPDVGLHCWAAAFPAITEEGPAARQLRRLDSTRGHIVSSFKKSLGFNPGPLPSGNKGYYGRPYSYYGILTDAERHASFPINPYSYGEW